VRDPICLDIRFSRPVRFEIKPGENGRSILLYLLPDSSRIEPATRLAIHSIP
jgi:hypothetical protein